MLIFKDNNYEIYKTEDGELIVVRTKEDDILQVNEKIVKVA